MQAEVNNQHTQTRQHVTDELQSHRDDFWIDFMYLKHIGKALAMMSEQLDSAAMQEIFAVGMFFDAQEQMQAQRLFQAKSAQAHKDYHTDTGMCSIGTITRGLGAASRNAELASFAIHERGMERLMNARNSSGTFAVTSDKPSRLEQFKTRFCELNDNNNDMVVLCAAGPASKELVNKDIDFTHTVLQPMTMDVDFSNTVVTNDERALLALSSNLYNHDVFKSVPGIVFSSGNNMQYLLGLRGVAAKHSVAMHSFNSIAGMKAAGTANSASAAPFLQAVLRQLGVTAADAVTLVGARPSYNSQMELLTKKIYQQPFFYTDLYVSPANIERKAAALQAIRLMQDTDRLKSGLRSEAMWSVLLELAVDESQQKLMDRMLSITPTLP